MEEIDSELIDPVVEPTSEKTHRTARALLSAVPYFGGGLVETFSAIIEPPMERRKKEWMAQVTNAINELIENHHASEEDLQNNEKFITTIIHASTAALRNHHKEKIIALRNAVYNAGATSINENKALLFIKVVDEITPTHLLVLDFLNDPDLYQQKLELRNGPNTSFHDLDNQKIWEESYPEFKHQTDFINHIVKELHFLSFIHQASLPGSMGRVTTDYGREFLRFIGREIK